MLNLPFPCRIYRVHCRFCRKVIGHMIVASNATERQALNRAHSVYTIGEVHNSVCERERYQQTLIATKNTNDFTVALI